MRRQDLLTVLERIPAQVGDADVLQEVSNELLRLGLVRVCDTALVEFDAGNCYVVRVTACPGCRLCGH